MKRKMCPFYQNECMGKKCKFWGGEDCLIVEKIINLPVLIPARLSEPDEKDERENFEESPLARNYEEDSELMEQNKTEQEPEDSKKQLETHTETEKLKEEKISEDELMKLLDPRPLPPTRSRNRFFGEFDEVPKYLEKPTEEIAQELADYCFLIKPNLANWHEFHNVRDMFWESKNSRTYHLPAEYRMKVDEIEKMAKKILIDKKIPDFLRTSTINELATEMSKTLLKTSGMNLRKEWRDERLKGLDLYELPQELQDKIEEAYDLVRERVAEQQEVDMRDRAIELVPELIEWCKSKDLPEINRLSVHAFVYEKEIDLSLGAQAYLEFLANAENR
ncbi:MAG: hypothetical protein ACTSRE_16790 [Promethearchaeota archaeon]